MKKAMFIVIPLIFMITGCALFKNPLDKRMGFSESLSVLEKAIVEENHDLAGESIIQSMEKWEKIKPYMQIEIDHDVVNKIESELTALSAYIETKNKSMSLASIRVIINMWSDIGAK